MENQMKDPIPIWFITTLIICFFLTPSLVCPYNEITENDQRNAIKGEIVVKPAKTHNGLKGLQAIFAVRASRKDIWKTLTDYDHFQQIFQDIYKMKVVESGESGATIEFWADAVITKLHYELYRKYEVFEHKLSWKKTSGDLKQIEGSWTILDTDDPEIKILVYDSYIKVGMLLVPEWMVRKGAMRKAKTMSEGIRNWIEQHKSIN